MTTATPAPLVLEPINFGHLVLLEMLENPFGSSGKSFDSLGFSHLVEVLFVLGNMDAAWAAYRKGEDAFRAALVEFSKTFRPDQLPTLTAALAEAIAPLTSLAATASEAASPA